LAAIFRDEEHSIDEAREFIIGNSIVRRLLLVYFTADYENFVGQQKSVVRALENCRTAA
jgi:uncharacterized DUF497 family protein